MIKIYVIFKIFVKTVINDCNLEILQNISFWLMYFQFSNKPCNNTAKGDIPRTYENNTGIAKNGYKNTCKEVGQAESSVHVGGDDDMQIDIHSLNLSSVFARINALSSDSDEEIDVGKSVPDCQQKYTDIRTSKTSETEMTNAIKNVETRTNLKNDSQF